MPEHFDVERTASRSEAAGLLRAMADGVERGTVDLVDAAGSLAVDVPEDLTYEVELETVAAGGDSESPEGADAAESEHAGDADAVEVEVELVWPAGPDSGVSAPPSDREPGSVDESERDETTDDPSVAASGPVVSPGGGGSAARFELFTDRADEWRWRLVHDNGNVIADGGEGYTRKANARKGLESVRANAPGAEIVEVTEGE